MKHKKGIVILVVGIAILGFSLTVLDFQGGSSPISGSSLSTSSTVSNTGSVNRAPVSTNSGNVASLFNNINKTANDKLGALANENSMLGNLSKSASFGKAKEHLFMPDLKAMGSSHVSNGVIAPSYTNAPAPMGIGFYGTGNVSGILQGYNFSTSSYEATLSLSSLYTTNILNDNPENVSFQLNTIMANVTLFGQANFSMWTQNVITYNGTSHIIGFEDNIWNFSNNQTYLTSNAIYSSTGAIYPYPGVHIALGPQFQLHGAFVVDLYLNATLINGRDAVFFNYSIPQIGMSGTYDGVIFNSTYGQPAGYSAPMSDFLVSGTTLTPVGLPYDAEFMIGGPGGGSNTNVLSINGSMTLSYLNGTTSSYESVPSAYNIGSDTGETSVGVSTYWTANKVVHLDTGPSIISGMWGIPGGSSPGYFTASGILSPSNGFVFINQGGASNPISAQWAPTSLSGAFSYKLSPGTYSAQFLASNYAPAINVPLVGTNGGVINVGSISDLTYDALTGAYTPLFASNPSQLANISVGGTGTMHNPFVLMNLNPELSPLFGGINDFAFPVFPAVLLNNTDSYTLMANPVQPVVPVYDYLGGLLSAMPFFFNGVQHLTVYGAQISSSLFSIYPVSVLGFFGGEMDFFASSHDSVVSSVFLTQFDFASIISSDITVRDSIAYGIPASIANPEIPPFALSSAFASTNFVNDSFMSTALLFDYGASDNVIGNSFVGGFDVAEYSAVNLFDNNFSQYAMEIAPGFNEYLPSAFESLFTTVGGSSNMFLNGTFVTVEYGNAMLSNSYFNQTIVAGYFGDVTLVNSVIVGSDLGAINGTISVIGRGGNAFTGNADHGSSYGSVIAAGSVLSGLDGNLNIVNTAVSASTLGGFGVNLNMYDSSSTGSDVAIFGGNLTMAGVNSNGDLMILFGANVVLSGTNLFDSQLILEIGTLFMTHSNLYGSYYLSYLAYNVIEHSTISTTSSSWWFVLAVNSTNVFTGDTFVTTGVFAPPSEYTLGSLVSPTGGSPMLNITPNSVQIFGGESLISGSTFVTLGGNQATDLVLQSGYNTVTGNLFYTRGVSLDGNFYGQGSSIVVYGGFNTITHNRFVTSQSQAMSSLLILGGTNNVSRNVFSGTAMFGQDGFLGNSFFE